MSAMVSTVKVPSCKECGLDIVDDEFCAYDCANDGKRPRDRPPGSVIVRTYRRTDELMKEEVWRP